MKVNEAVFDEFPLVSVVMATYNGERFLRQQLDSIIAQTYPNLEIVIVDDASTDKTIEILDKYSESNKNLMVYKGLANLGYIRNFERGLRLCHGEYIALSDQDDIWLPEKIITLMAQRSNHPLIYCNSELINSEGDRMDVKLTDLKNLLDFWTPLNYVVGGTASGHAMLVKREVIEESFPLPGMITHDYWIGYVATTFGPMKFVDEVLVQYRQHGGNVIGVNAAGSNATKARKLSKKEHNGLIRDRIHLMYVKCPERLVKAKKALFELDKSYQRFSLYNNFLRMQVFLRHRKEVTAYKKKGELRSWLFCLKMFFKIV